MRPAAARDVALFTDGLQSLALLYADRTAYAPFFDPLFDGLGRAKPDAMSPGALARFLDSPAVNDRTVNDKTLVLAARLQRNGLVT